MGNKFKNGDFVIVKQWDAMVNEFGTNCFGNIPCRGTFVKNMRHLCGRVGFISRMNGAYIDLKDAKGNYVDDGYLISTDMIEPCLANHKIAKQIFLL